MDVSLKVRYSDDARFDSIPESIKHQVEAVKKINTQSYTNSQSYLSLSFDESLRAHVYALVAQKKLLSPDAMIIVGIGGSNLGTLALQEALFGLFYNQQHPEFPVYYADTMDERYYTALVSCLEKSHRPLLVIISKSGTTLESVANAQLFLDLLTQRLGKDTSQYVVVISDEGSVLCRWAHTESFSYLPIPAVVGGRYSVLSAVGLFPLAMMGVDIDELHAGARESVYECMGDDYTSNKALVRAQWLVAQRRSGNVVHDCFVFSKELNAFGGWYRQLMAESLGKTPDAGIIPTTSVGTIDLHSVAQLALGGPRIIATTFIDIAQDHGVRFKNREVFESLTPGISASSIHELLQAALHGTQRAYTQADMPFCTITLSKLSAYTCGQLLQLCMQEIMYAGYLLQINPFDQPEVELYKREMRKILAHE